MNDTNYKYVNDFSNGRAFVRQDNGDYILIDRNFKRVGTGSYNSILNDRFQDGYAIVEAKYEYGIIDTMGNFVVQPQYEEIDRAGIVNGYFFFSEEKDDTARYGVSDLKGNVVIKAIMSEFDRNGFVNGLLKAVINDKLTYINKKGAIVWQQEEEKSTSLKPLNIDFMNRGYFYAYSSPKNSATDYSGGWATSLNKPKTISVKAFPNDTLAVTIDTNRVDTFATSYLGYTLYISNTTSDTISFNAQDSRLYMKLQAQDKNGAWKDIEYLPSSWCGNSYRTIQLEPRAFWTFIIPYYQGGLQTKIRAELKHIDKTNPKKNKVIYSNLINSSINPAQFWNKRTYYPNGLMDPYND